MKKLILLFVCTLLLLTLFACNAVDSDTSDEKEKLSAIDQLEGIEKDIFNAITSDFDYDINSDFLDLVGAGAGTLRISDIREIREWTLVRFYYESGGERIQDRMHLYEGEDLFAELVRGTSRQEGNGSKYHDIPTGIEDSVNAKPVEDEKEHIAKINRALEEYFNEMGWE